ncbi:glycosyl hydrolase 115 family protein [Thalassobellus sediminis]|uniref:glycosyl hydrolase 115 family protein n=1 Tax=Thalassobellus sediminis TaxID=3367753 RepID=UPI0037A20452
MKILNKIRVFSTVLLMLLVTITNNAQSINTKQYVINEQALGSFPLASNGNVASILISDDDFAGVKRVAGHLKNDIKNVTNTFPNTLDEELQVEDYLVIIGTLGKSKIINRLVTDGKIDKTGLEGKREKFITQIIDNPLTGVKKALVIAGSDKRGTIYGIYDLSKQIGVSPWYFWADVPIKKQAELHVLPGNHTMGEPKVKYRGIFINDEAPALTGWADENYGDLNSKFYEQVFELILRLKGNYLWPAMWGNAFNDDDPLNQSLADEYGIVMGTSHHEPMVRSQQEWKRYGKGEWNYNTNKEGLNDFWRKGIQNMGDAESLVTIGMRGDGDEPMSEETATDLLESIVKSQREIIEEVTGKPADKTPQIWALYKEVQDYYDKGMQVPDDVTLLLCDDNWGNLRKLPSLNAKPRKGGYGIYYHFDYVGGPRSYKWTNTNQIERVWEQMHLAYKHGVDDVWIVNVGDIKPMEFPVSFFLDYAWNPEKWDANNLQDYYHQWAKDNFGGQFTEDIANLLRLYTKYNARKTPELLDINTYSLIDYNEAETIVNDYNALVEKAKEINEQLKPEYKDAFYQLVLYHVLAGANLNELYVTVARNKLYAEQGRASTNLEAEKVKDLFNKVAEFDNHYNKVMSNGKWNHMMSQAYIGATNWRAPSKNIMPETKTIELSSNSEVGVAVEGSKKWWPNATEETILPTFISFENNTFYFDVFNKGTESFCFKIKSKSKWLIFSKIKGTIDKEERIKVTIDWGKAPIGLHKTSFIVKANKKSIPVFVQTNNVDLKEAKGFVENNGFIAIDAIHFSNKSVSETFKWVVVDNLGKTGSSIISLPIEKGRVVLNENAPKLSYNVNFQTIGTVKVHMYFSPTINYANREGLYYGLSFDKEKPIQINYDSDPNIFNYNGKVPSNWHTNVSDKIKVITTEFEIDKAGNHTLNYYRVDEGLVLQKIIIETESSHLKDTYLGPKQSFKKN